MTTAHEARIRRLAGRLGYAVRKSRRVDLNSGGEYCLVDRASGFAVFGWHFDASLSEIEAWLREPVRQEA